MNTSCDRCPGQSRRIVGRRAKHRGGGTFISVEEREILRCFGSLGVRHEDLRRDSHSAARKEEGLELICTWSREKEMNCFVLFPGTDGCCAALVVLRPCNVTRKTPKNSVLTGPPHPPTEVFPLLGPYRTTTPSHRSISVAGSLQDHHTLSL